MNKVKTLIGLTLIVTILLFLNIQKNSPLHVDEPKNIQYDHSTNTLNLSSLTLKQKIAQMIIVYGSQENKETLQNMLIGGIYLNAKSSEEEFKTTINNFQNKSHIPFFVTVDLEGCNNPFDNFKQFPTPREIKNEKEAYTKGYEEGKLLKEIGFNLNFAPVLDLEDPIWNCRNFEGTPEEISKKANAYIKGLQENEIIATAKHYPGETLSTKDPHKQITFATIEENDLIPFKNAINSKVDAIMVSHTIVNGLVSSENKPSSASEKITNELRSEFTGLIITDEIRMSGIKEYYNNTEKQYIDLFKADNDIILNFDSDTKKILDLIGSVEDAVNKGEISEDRIDRSVTRILRYKGINVVE